MKILITGATGFIGSHLVEALTVAGHAIRVVVRQTSDTRWIDHLDVDRVVGDLRDRHRLPELVQDMDAVVHGGGVTRAKDRDTFMAVNAEGSALLAQAAAAAGVQRYVLLSSLAARGPDQAQAPGDAPVSWYGLSKLQAERNTRAAARGSDMDVVALRLGGVYGPRDTDLLPLFQSAARGFLPLPPARLHAQPVHVDDVVQAVLASLESSAGFGPWPVADAGVYDWAEMGRHLKACLDRRVVSMHVPSAIFLTAARLSERWARWRNEAPRLDLRRAEDLCMFSYTTELDTTLAALPWSPTVALPEGLAGTLAWYRQQGWVP